MEISDENAIAEINEASKSALCIIFKHSTTCGVSAMAKRRLLSEYPAYEARIRFYYLDLLAHRALSNLVAETYGVRHESPQLLAIVNGKAADHHSHHLVSFESFGGLLSA